MSLAEHHKPIMKRGRYWVILDREGNVIRGERFRSRRAAEDSYEHYLSLGGNPLHVERELPPERIPKGYYVAATGHTRKRPSKTFIRTRMEHIGHKTRFQKEY